MEQKIQICDENQINWIELNCVFVWLSKKVAWELKNWKRKIKLIWRRRREKSVCIKRSKCQSQFVDLSVKLSQVREEREDKNEI